MPHTIYMRRANRMVFCACILLAGMIHAQAAKDSSDDDAIRKLVAKYMAARNSRDPQATRALFTSDADQLVSTGEWRKGIDALVRGAMASSQKEASKSSIVVESIRLLDPDMAIVDGRYQTISASTGASRKMWTTLVLKRVDSEWRIAAIRNMLPASAATEKSH
jgi:uncharacterized protein (TIGR02246 family)